MPAAVHRAEWPVLCYSFSSGQRKNMCLLFSLSMERHYFIADKIITFFPIKETFPRIFSQLKQFICNFAND